MKKLLLIMAALLALATSATAQEGSRRYTRPRVPSRDALNRLNLQLAWHTYVSTNGLRDGLLSVQVIDHDQVLVQNRDGLITLLDANDGTTLWRANPGQSGAVFLRPAYDSRSVISVRGSYVFSLDRKTGKTKWTYKLAGGASAAPLADDQMLYTCLSPHELDAYLLPEAQVLANKAREEKLARKFGTAAKPATPSGGTASSGSGYGQSPAGGAGDRSPTGETALEPLHEWTYSGDDRLERAPIQTQDLVVVAGVDGTFVAVDKQSGKVPWRYKTKAAVSAPLGQYGNTAYLASQDFNTYAFDLPSGRLLWRFTAQSPIVQRPWVNDTAIYIAPFREGLHRLRRGDGEEVWFSRDANRFLAANPRFVYATDMRGRLLVLDQGRGTTLGSLDTGDFVVPVSNQRTDRVFLASNDGLIVCLHDRNYPKPVLMRHEPDTKAKPVPQLVPHATSDKKKPKKADEDE